MIPAGMVFWRELKRAFTSSVGVVTAGAAGAAGAARTIP